MQTQQAISLLEWYITAGVDEIVSNTPQDYFALTKTTTQSIIPMQTSRQQTATKTNTTPTRANNTQHKTSPILTTSPAMATKKARELADKANTIDELRQAVEEFDGCLHKKTAYSTVFSDGNPDADLMLIGEAPDRDEDRKGTSFAGESGQLLDKMLNAIGYDRESFYASNIVFWHPAGGRSAKTEELDICLPFIEKHIALSNPKTLVMVGQSPAKSLLNKDTGITRLRGKIYDYNNQYVEDRTIKAIATFHPSYLFQHPAHKRLAWQDLLKIKEIMQS